MPQPKWNENNDEPTIDEMNAIFGPQKLTSAETVPMLEQQLARLDQELAALINHLENGKDIGDHVRSVRLERDSIRKRLEAARFERERLN